MMKYILKGRACGKTYDLLQWLRQKSTQSGEVRVAVFPSKERAMEMRRQNPDLASWQFVSAEEVLNRRGEGMFSALRGRVNLGIDNLEMFLGQATEWRVSVVTDTPEEVLR